jgi:hypothetical protein
MPNLRFSFIATAGTVTVNAPDITAPQEALFIDWLWSQYAPKDTVEGSPTFGQTLPRTGPNEVEAYRNYARALWAGTRANVIRWKHELDKAAVVPPNVPE